MSSAIPPNHILSTSCELPAYLVAPIGKFCQFNFAGAEKGSGTNSLKARRVLRTIGS